MKIQNNQFLSLEQLQDRYLNQNRQTTSKNVTQNGLRFQDILSQKTEVSIESEVKFSKHAANRLVDRNIELTKEQVDAGGEWDYARCRYIMTTKDGTYLLYYASDVQFTVETMAEYRQMEEEISDIRFVIDHALE